jgi:putative NADH-flavin reductase
MKIIVFGASGKTGHEVVKQALEHDHQVTAYVRHPARLTVQHKNLDIREGHLDYIGLVTKTIQGHDAVISTLGAMHPLKYDPIVVKGFEQICSSMVTAGVKRLIYLSPLSMKESRSDSGIFLHYIAPIILRTEVRGHEVRENMIRQSALDWTIVQVPFLTLGPHTGNFKMGDDIKFNGFLPKLSRADVADAMLRQLEDKNAVRKIVRVLPPIP